MILPLVKAAISWTRQRSFTAVICQRPLGGVLWCCLELKAVTRDGLFVSDSECYPPK